MFAPQGQKLVCSVFQNSKVCGVINYMFKLNAQPKCLGFCVNARIFLCNFHIYFTENQLLAHIDNILGILIIIM